MVYLTNVNLNGNELQNAIIQPLATAPTNPKYGQVYTDSVSGKIKQYNGSEWVTIGAMVEDSETNGNLVIDGVEMTVYELPTASADVVGGVKVGGGLSVAEDGTVSRNINYFNGIREVSEDGVAELDNAAIARIVGDATPYEGDICVIRTLISGTAYSYMAYVYENGTWNAMDGNVDATNVIMRADIVTAGDYTQVGNVTKNKTATGSIPAAGKSVADVFTAIFTKELNPSATDPKVTVTLTDAGAKEVGTEFTPTYSASLSAGSYTYGPATGIVAKTWAISDSAGATATTASGSFTKFTVTDTTSYKVSATATHDAGAIPKTNLGNDYASKQIAAGSKSGSSGTVTGYRSFFYGSNVTAIALNSANIREKLTNSGKAVGTSQTFDMSIVEGATQVVIAFPTNINKTLSAVLDAGAFGTDIVGKFEKSEVDVEGVNGHTAISYDVWVYSPSTALGANTYTVTIA